MVVLQDIEEDEYGRKMDMPENCTVFISQDNFERGVKLEDMEAQYYNGEFSSMLEDRRSASKL